MRIEQDLPFDICETCCECVLDVNEQILFANDGNCHRVIRVGCKNEGVCRNLKERLKDESDKGIEEATT